MVRTDSSCAILFDMDYSVYNAPLSHGTTHCTVYMILWMVYLSARVEHPHTKACNWMRTVDDWP